MKVFYINIFLLFSISSWSEQEQPSGIAIELEKSFEKPEEYESFLREKMTSFMDKIDARKKECTYQYKTLELKDGESKESKPRKLSEKERDICLSQLKSGHLKLLQELYTAREQFLDYTFKMYKQRNEGMHKKELINIESFYSQNKKNRR